MPTALPLPPAFLVVVLAAAAGACVGAAMIPATRHALREVTLPRAGCAISIATTAVAFALVVSRFGPSSHAGPGLALAAVGAPLAVVDVLERRLPTTLVVTGLALGSCAVVVEALLTATPPLIGRAAVSGLVLGAGYLVLALVSRGGLGSGDVRLAVLVGLVLGPAGWTRVLMATAVTWLLAATAVLVMRARRGDDGAIPLGPFLILGALLGALRPDL